MPGRPLRVRWPKQMPALSARCPIPTISARAGAGTPPAWCSAHCPHQAHRLVNDKCQKSTSNTLRNHGAKGSLKRMSHNQNLAPNPREGALERPKAVADFNSSSTHDASSIDRGCNCRCRCSSRKVAGKTFDSQPLDDPFLELSQSVQTRSDARGECAGDTPRPVAGRYACNGSSR